MSEIKQPDNISSVELDKEKSNQSGIDITLDSKPVTGVLDTILPNPAEAILDKDERAVFQDLVARKENLLKEYEGVGAALEYINNVDYVEKNGEGYIRIHTGKFLGKYIDMAMMNYKEGEEEFFTWDEAVAAAKAQGKELPDPEDYEAIINALGGSCSFASRLLHQLVNFEFRGCRDANSGRIVSDRYAFVWSSGVKNDGTACGLIFSSDTVYPKNWHDRRHGFAVRFKDKN